CAIQFVQSSSCSLSSLLSSVSCSFSALLLMWSLQSREKQTSSGQILLPYRFNLQTITQRPCTHASFKAPIRYRSSDMDSVGASPHHAGVNHFQRLFPARRCCILLLRDFRR